MALQNQTANTHARPYGDSATPPRAPAHQRTQRAVAHLSEEMDANARTATRALGALRRRMRGQAAETRYGVVLSGTNDGLAAAAAAAIALGV